MASVILYQSCDGVDGADVDQDGYASTLSGGTDCDDSVATTYPGAADSAGDVVDNSNCDGVDGVDADRDGQASNQSGGTTTVMTPTRQSTPEL